MDFPNGDILPWNSRKLKTLYVKAIAKEMNLSTKGSAEDIKLSIEGELTRTSHAPQNVQVVVEGLSLEPKEKTRLCLLDERGVFLTVEVGCEVSKTDGDDGVHTDDVHARIHECVESLRDEISGLKGH